MLNQMGGRTDRRDFENPSLTERRCNNPAVRPRPGGDEIYDLTPLAPRFARPQAWAAICTGSQGLESGGV